MKKRISCLLLAMALCLSMLPVAAFARETDFFPELPEPFDYDAMIFDDGCIEETRTACEEALSLLGNILNIGALCEAYETVLQLHAEVQTQAAMATVLYYGDPDRCGSLYSSMMADTENSNRLVLRSLQTIFTDSVCGASMRSYAGEEQVNAVMSAAVPSDRQLSLSRQETELTMAYRQAAEEEYTCVFGQKKWTVETALAAFSAGKLTAAEYREIMYGIYEKRSQRLGEIYLQLLKIRREIAAEAGYSDYSHYAYKEIYFRDYSPEDVAAYSAAVKRYIVPLYREMEARRRLGCFSDGAVLDGLSEEAMLDTLSPYMQDISSELGDSFGYMRQCNLIDAEPRDTKLPVCFTTGLPAWNAAYIFCTRYGGNQDMGNLIHEFGHFNAMLYGAGSGSYDTLELHSQGMEVLLLAFAEELYGTEAQNQVGNALYELLYLVIVGCAYDALQQYAYATPDVTVEALHRKSASLAAEYGLDAFGPEGLDYTWPEISHTFESPLYYISYSTSALLALELYGESCSAGVEAAADQYLNFVSLSSVLGDFREIVAASGLHDPFAESTIRNLAEEFPACLEKQALRMPFADAEDCWAKEDIVLLYLMGVMNGVSASSFAPEASMSRAMAVTVLYRLCGCPAASKKTAEKFTDVSPGSWYASAVAWAVERGIVRGTTETTFSPDGILSCQEFALLLFRLLNGSGGEREDDAGTGADLWAAGAVLWCSDNAIFESESGGVPPKAALTRAELAAAIVNFLDVI